MSPYIPPRYQQSYRRREISFICRQALRGESLCLIGVAGSGKSNLIKFLRDDKQAKQQYLGGRTDRVHFPDVDAQGWDGTTDTLWSMMADALGRVTDHLQPPARPYVHDHQHRLQEKLAWICGEEGHQVMFLLDEFDDVLRTGPRSLFDQISRLRSAGHRERLSFLVFTRKLPHILGRKHELDTLSKFYDLIRYNIFALPMHTRDDTMQMLLHLNAKANNRLNRSDLTQIGDIVGGHTRLTKVLFEIWLRNPGSRASSVQELAMLPEIQDECRRIMKGLHRQEDEVAVRFVHDAHLDGDLPTLRHLQRRGLLTEDWRCFSMLLYHYLREQSPEGG